MSNLLNFINALNASGKLDYSDYSQLHDLASNIEARLAEYEDTGLSPAEIADLQKENKILKDKVETLEHRHTEQDCALKNWNEDACDEYCQIEDCVIYKCKKLQKENAELTEKCNVIYKEYSEQHELLDQYELDCTDMIIAEYVKKVQELTERLEKAGCKMFSAIRLKLTSYQKHKLTARGKGKRKQKRALSKRIRKEIDKLEEK